MPNTEKQDWSMMLLSLYFQASDGETEHMPNEQLLQELLEVINDSQPCLGVDQYLS